MKLKFVCATNDFNVPYINGAVFKTNKGRLVTIDRNETEFSFDEENGLIDMEWNDLYKWNGKTENYKIGRNFFKTASFDHFEIEDDAPDGYECRPFLWEAIC